VALTEDFTWQLGDTGVTLNTDSLSLPFVDIEKVIGMDSSEYRESERDHEGVDGGFLDAEFEKGRSLLLNGTAYATVDTIEELLDRLKEDFAPSRTLKPLYYKPAGQAERVWFVKPQGVRYDFDQAVRTGICAVQMKAFAEQSFTFSNNLQDFPIALGALITSGFDFPFGFPFGFGGVSSVTDAVLIIGGGNRPTPPTFIINGPVVNPQIVSDTAGKTLQFKITIDVGQTLVIDTYYKTVKLNGVTNRRNTLVAPNWFYLEKGENSLRFRAESGSGNLQVQFRSAWR
jgi:hypothetical protein